MKRQEHNQYVIHKNYAECFVYNIHHELLGSFIIDLDDIETCKSHRWWFSSNKKYTKVVTDINNKKITLARYLLGYKGKLQIDHINRNPLDNRRCNLRIVTPVENNANKNGRNIDQYPNGRYKSSFIRYGTYFYIGFFNTPEEAKEAKKRKLKEVEANKDYYLSEYKKRCGEKIKGVAIIPSGRWRADVVCNGKLKRIGTFDTKEEAALAREKYIENLEAS